MGPCSSGDLASVSPNGPLDPGDLQARPFRAEKLTEVMSMGTEAVLTGSYGGLTGNDMYKADTDHRAFVLGMLAVA